MTTVLDLMQKNTVIKPTSLKRIANIKINPNAPVPSVGAVAVSFRGTAKSESGNAIYDIQINVLNHLNKIDISCGCKDWWTRGAHVDEGDRKTSPCKHLLAFAKNCALPPQADLDEQKPVEFFPTGNKPSQPSPAAPANKKPPKPFQERVSDAVKGAIEAMSYEIEALLQDAQVPLVIGPTGCGKTSAHRMIALRNGQGLIESAGAASYSDADLVGIVHVNGVPFPGPVADAFTAAREMGTSVLLFLDEFTRFNARAQEALMRPLLPIAADAARAMGIETDVPVRVTSAPFWGTEWGPANKIQMSLACNPWGTTIDPALIRRTVPIYVDFPDTLSGLFSDKIGQAIKASWGAVRDGRWPLPIEYQALTKATSPDDTSIFRAYSYRLRAIDPAASEGFNAILGSLGLSI